MSEYSNETDKTKLLDSLGFEERGAVHRDRIVMRLFQLNIEALIESVDKTSSAITAATAASNSLGRKVFWLNVILAIATVSGLIISAISFVRSLNA